MSRSLELDDGDLKEMWGGEPKSTRASWRAMCMEMKTALSSCQRVYFQVLIPEENVYLYAQRNTYKGIRCSIVWNKKTLGTNLNAHQKKIRPWSIHTWKILQPLRSC